MKRPIQQRAVILYEALMALALAMALSVGVAQILTVAVQQRRLARQHAAAVREAGNLMEQLALRSWEETAPGRAPVSLSESCRLWLPDAELKLEIADEEPGARRIRVEIAWPDLSGRPGKPVCLVGWKFRDEEKER